MGSVPAANLPNANGGRSGHVSGSTSAVTFDAILNRAPVPSVRLNPRIPGDLEKILNKLLEKTPAQRYKSAEKLRADLERLKRDTGSGRIVAAATIPVEKSVAVLYFENLSGAKDDQYFRDGMTEDIITELSKINRPGFFRRRKCLFTETNRSRRLKSVRIGATGPFAAKT